MPLESVKMKNENNWALSCFKLDQNSEFHESGTFGGYRKYGQTHRQTHIHTRFMFYK